MFPGGPEIRKGRVYPLFGEEAEAAPNFVHKKVLGTAN